MANKKDSKAIHGIGKNSETHLVQKSNPLFGLWRSELTLAQFKIMDAYLARINSHDPTHRTVRLDKGEIEQYLGVTRINTEDLRKRLAGLGTMVPIDDFSKPKGFRLISLFEKADCEQNENGIWQVELTCTPSARKYIFNAEGLGYFRYTLHTVICLRSRYSYILFQYLEKNRCMHLTWDTDVDELRTLLNANEDLYQDFKRFNDRLLKLCHKELNEKTDCHFDYTPVKKGRRVVAIRFTLKPVNLKVDDPLPGQLSLEDLPSDPGTDLIELLRSATTPPGSAAPEFTRAEMEQLFTVLATVSVDKLPHVEPDNNIKFRRYHYLSERYAAMNRQAERKPIKHRFAYLLKLIQNDAG